MSYDRAHTYRLIIQALDDEYERCTSSKLLKLGGTSEPVWTPEYNRGILLGLLKAMTVVTRLARKEQEL